jgi:tripartite-type tricarboxylate transporter receptor subunit TctC
MEQLMPVKLARHWRTAAAVALVLPLAACGGADEGSAVAGGCDVPEEIKLVVPFSPGGGYDAWGRLIAPVMAEKLEGTNRITVENLDGGGGMRGVNTVYSGPSDGSQVVIFSPQDAALAQTLGIAPDSFDVTSMSFIGQFTEDPQIFLAPTDAEFDSIADLTDREEPVKLAVQEPSAVDILTYETYDIDVQRILHEGTPEVHLSLKRGDTEMTVGSLSSVLDYLASGDVKPVLYVGSEDINPELPGYEYIKEAPTPESTGHPELSESLSQTRVMAAAPGTSECVQEELSQALQDTLEDDEFLAQAEESGLRVVYRDAEGAATSVQGSLETMKENQAVLEEGMQE